MENRNFFKDGVSVFGTQLFILVIGFVSGIILARVLGPDGRGIFASLLVYPTIIVSLLSLGVTQAIVYFLGTKKYSDSEIIGVVLLLLLILSIVGVFLSIIIFSFIKNPDFNQTLILLSSLSIPAQLTLNYSSGILVGKQQISKYNKITSLAPLFNFTLIALFVLFGGINVLGAVLAILLAQCLLALYALKLINRERALKIRYLPELIKKTLSLGFVYAISSFILNLNYRADIIILQQLSNASEIGQYTIGVNFAELLWQLPAALGVVIFSYSANSKDSDKFSRDLVKIMRITFPIVLIGSTILYFVSDYIIPFLYGKEYIPSIKMLKLLLPGIVIMSLFKIIDMDLAGKGKPYVTIAFFIPALLINVMLNFLLIPTYGGCGAAFASTISYCVASFSILYYYLKINQLSARDIFILRKSDLNKITYISNNLYNWIIDKTSSKYK